MLLRSYGFALYSAIVCLVFIRQMLQLDVPTNQAVIYRFLDVSLLKVYGWLVET